MPGTGSKLMPPQHFTVPFTRSAHVYPSPASSALPSTCRVDPSLNVPIAENGWSAPARTTGFTGDNATEVSVTVVKAAATDFPPSIVREHVSAVPALAQSPPHPTRRKPTSGVAVRVTSVSIGSVAEQVAPHVMPAGDVTRPPPVAATEIV